MLFALFAGRLVLWNMRRQVPTHFFFNDFQQRNVRRTHAGGVAHQGATAATTAGVELADPLRYQVNQNVGVANLLQCFFTEFGLQDVSYF